ncbi:MAG TPA: HAMP domain-containing sensor histidine kinase [Terriglobales bacterium]|nr:HAMP domain-containing sensor histidine kinase [Terriglobales bacterium]
MPSLRQLAGQAAIPAALVLPIALVAALTAHARSTERSHRATAERVVRDYAAFAAWQFDRHAFEHLQGDALASLDDVRRVGPKDPLPPPSVLQPDTGKCGCGFKTDYRFGFRLDVASGAFITDRPAPPAAREALARRAALMPREIVPRAKGDTTRDDGRHQARLRVDPIAGTLHLLTYTVVRDDAGRARAVYGVAADPKHLGTAFARIVREQTLLPPSLVGRAPNDSVVTIRVATPDGRVLFGPAARPAGPLVASDTIEAWAGGFVTTVGVRPAAAASLVIGGLPPSRLPWLLAMLGGGIVLAGVGLLQLRRARELARLRAQFVANVSHELRTPLTQISMFGETLLLGRERSAEEREHFLSVIYREARRLTTLVESVLRFSRAEAGGAATAAARGLRPEPRDVAADVADAVAAFAPLAEAADTALTVDLAHDAYAHADAGALRQILLNLLDNAVKYGPRGQTVVVRAARVNAEVVVSVEDEGPGVPPADRERVFDAFTRLERPGLPRVSGTGVGLAVVRDLVRAHGGRAWIETGRRGARVCVALPACAAPTAPAATDADARAEALEVAAR